LVSWYPNRLDNFDGDFIQRHARAVALYCKVHVIYVKKDESMQPGTSLIVTAESGNLTEEIIYYNSTATPVKLLDKLLSYRSYKKYYAAAIHRYIERSGIPPVVHVHVAMKAGLAALWMKKKWSIPFIITEHWTGYHKQSVPSLYNQGRVFKRLNKEVLKGAKTLLPVTKDLGRAINLFAPHLPFRVVPNVVNTALFKYEPVVKPAFRFIHISYMNYQKNPGGIITAAAKLKEMGYDFEVLMLGNDNETLRAMANEHALLNSVIFFQQPVAYGKVAFHMQNASAFLLFSRFENLPCVILEALCCGLPVISSNVGGIAEVVDKENGILVESENTEQLVAAMKFMIDNYHSFDKLKISERATAAFNYNTVGEMIFENYG